MLLHIPRVLTEAELALCRQAIESADWVDGRVTAGHQSVRAKHNMQIPEGHPASQRLGAMVVAALERNPLFVSAALPLKLAPPLFNRYRRGETYGTHIDNAIRQITGTSYRLRTDLSATLFLNPPADYDGGELTVEDTYGAHQVKLPAGDMVLYPGASLHRVQPVTSGVRLASFFWVQSMVRDDGQRSLLFDLDNAIQRLGRDVPENPAVVQLTGIYHNLLRRWADS